MEAEDDEEGIPKAYGRTKTKQLNKVETKISSSHSKSGLSSVIQSDYNNKL
jgi:hypothetical protein